MKSFKSLIFRSLRSKTLLLFPGQGTQKLGMHLPYKNLAGFEKILASFDDSLQYPVRNLKDFYKNSLFSNKSSAN